MLQRKVAMHKQRTRTPSQEESQSLRQLKKSLYSVDQEPEDETHFLIDTVWFQIIVNLMTLLNAIQMGIEADHPDWTQVWLVCENIFTAGFTAEMVVKLWILRYRYFFDKANCLDCVVTVLGILDCWVMAAIGSSSDLQSLSILRILRLARLVRLLKLVRSFKPFVLVIRGVTKAMHTAVYIFALTAVIVYVFAIFTTQYLGRQSADLYPGFSREAEDIDEQEFLSGYNPYVCFGSIMSSMLTLFNVSVMAEWTEIVRPIAVKQPIYLPIFFCFVAFVTFGVMSVLIAAIVDVVNEESKSMELEYAEQELKEKRHILYKIEDHFYEMDTNCSGELEMAELEQAFQQNETLKALLKEIDLPVGWSATEFRDMLDSNGDHSLQREEFQAGLFRLLNSNDSQRLCLLATSINQVKKIIRDQNMQHAKAHSAILSDIASIKAALGITPESQKQPKDNQLSAQSDDEIYFQSTASMGSRTSQHSGDQVSVPSELVKKEEITTTPSTKALAGSTPTFPNPRVNVFTSGSQLEEALSAALAVVTECIHEEFAAIKSELKPSGKQKCSSLVEAAETQFSCPASPPSGPMLHPAGCEKPMASHATIPEVDSFKDGVHSICSGNMCTFPRLHPAESAIQLSARPKHESYSL